MKLIFSLAFLVSATAVCAQTTFQTQAVLDRAATVKASNGGGTGTLVHGEVIEGTPYLVNDWLPGEIILEDGRIYNTYRVKYEIFSQQVFFLNGNDSLQVTDEIKEFTLRPNKITSRYFINAAAYQKTPTPSYFEILINGATGQLLKSSKKKIVTESEYVSHGKSFEIEKTYLFYDLASQKLINLKVGNKEKFAAALKLSKAKAAEFGLPTVDLLDEDQLIKFINGYMADAIK